MMGPCASNGCSAPLLLSGWCRIHYKQANSAPRRSRAHRPKFKDDGERFLSKVTEGKGRNACFEIDASPNPRGYKRFGMGGRTLGAHVAAHELFIGPVPKGYEVHHRCENPGCVRPSHLVALTKEAHKALHAELKAAKKAAKTASA